MTSTLPYSILRSEDGITWTSIGTGGVSNGMVTFPTNTFSYFALVSATPVTPTVVPPVVTPPAPSGGSSGGGGSSYSSPSRDTCPAGDYSSNYYDGTCGTIPPANTTALIPENTNLMVISITGAPSRTLFSNSSIIDSYSFPDNERIPQKIASELNFIITKITKILDKKAE